MPVALAASPVDAAVARAILAAFLITFIAARVTVLLIMLRWIPTLYLRVGTGRTHVHHLNYGIVLMTLVGGFALLVQPGGAVLTWTAVAYGIALGLTYDEFGMWVHLGGAYWQRASLDAVTVIAATLGLIAFAPDMDRWRPHHGWTAAVLVVALLVFAAVLLRSLKYAARRVSPFFLHVEARGPEE